MLLPWLHVSGQSLPSFQAIAVKGSTTISWNAPSEKLTLLVIQKSLDSLNGFKSIASMPDPNTPGNGYVDKNNIDLNYYYRIFYAGSNGKYYFSDAKKAYLKLDQPIVHPIPTADHVKPVLLIENKDPAIPVMPAVSSIDTLASIAKKELIESVIPPKEDTINTGFHIHLITEKIEQESNLTTHPFLFVSKDNHLMLILPETHKRKFQLQVWKEDGTHVFNMKNIKDAQLLIDKSNFIYSGWFTYEISEGERLKEKGKFFIPAD